MSNANVRAGKKKSLSGYEATARLLAKRPEWAPIVADCVALYRESARTGFAGAWVFNRGFARGGFLPSNLRLLVGAGILMKTGNSRAGNRAYYEIPDVAGVERALQEFTASQ